MPSHPLKPGKKQKSSGKVRQSTKVSSHNKPKKPRKK